MTLTLACSDLSMILGVPYLILPRHVTYLSHSVPDPGKLLLHLTLSHNDTYSGPPQPLAQRK